MNINIEQLSALQKASKESFFEQKKLLKQVISGRAVQCSICKKPLTLYTPEQNELTGIRCAKGCTDIALDFA